MAITAIDFKAVKPSLWQMDGISARTMDEHIKLYQGYVSKSNEILQKIAELSEQELSAAHPTYSTIRELKVELSRALGGWKNHEIYFPNLGGKGGEPKGDLLKQIQKDFGSYDRWLKEFRATAASARGWAWLAWDYDLKKLIIAIGDEQNTFPIWNATPILACDVFEHAYFIDYGSARAGYLDAFFRNLDWEDVEKRFASLKL